MSFNTRWFSLLLILLLQLISSISADDSRLRMPGGSSFTMAWSMACSMRRKREAIFGRDRRAFVVPSVRQLQEICCNVGCSLSDLLSYCGPGW